MAFVEVRNVEKYYYDFRALSDISFEVEQGELIALLGPSGCGKTTLLRSIAGLELHDRGDIVIDGVVVNDTPPSERGIGFVFQNYALFRHMRVYDNIAFGLDAQKWQRDSIRKRVDELIGLIGVQGKEDHFPNELSGGQRQRVAFARAIAPNPRILLLDEPFAAVDAKVRQDLRGWLRETVTQLGITSIFVTHDQEEALEVSDRIIVMNDGMIEQIGTPEEIYECPETAFVAQFAGNAPIINEFDNFKGFEKTDPESVAIVRPEYVEAFRPDNPDFADYVEHAQRGVVTGISFRGFYFEVTVEVAGTSLTTHRGLSRRRSLSVGSEILVFIEKLCILHADNSVEIAENRALPALMNASARSKLR